MQGVQRENGPRRDLWILFLGDKGFEEVLPDEGLEGAIKG